MSTKSVTTSLAASVAVLLTAAGAQADVLWNNGGMITNPGAGFGGADVSLTSADLPSGATATHNNGTNFRRTADDFIVSAGGWTVNTITCYATMGATYPAGTPTSPITSVRVDLYNNLPANGAANQVSIASSTAILTNSWTGIYQILNGGSFSDTTRPIFALTLDFGSLNLAPGTYGISFSINGLAPGSVTAVGVPFVRYADAGGTPVTATGNARSGLSSTGNPGTYTWTALSTSRGGISYPFLVNGTATPTPGAGLLLGLGGLAAARRRRS